MGFKLLQNEDKINPLIQILWKVNTKYRDFLNLHCLYTDYIFRPEPVKEKSGLISNETINFYLNSLT